MVRSPRVWAALAVTSAVAVMLVPAPAFGVPPKPGTDAYCEGLKADINSMLVELTKQAGMPEHAGDAAAGWSTVNMLIDIWVNARPGIQKCGERFSLDADRGLWDGDTSGWRQATAERAHLVAGDFTGDGRTDVSAFSWADPVFGSSLYYQDAVLASAPLPTAQTGPVPPGTFRMNALNQPELLEFRAWSAKPGAELFAGDFNGDGRDDFALAGGNEWTTIPVAFRRADGGYTVTSRAVPGFAIDAAQPDARLVVGDFNGDGRDDFATVGQPNIAGVRAALSTTDGYFNDVSMPVSSSFLAWAAEPGVGVVAGDFNGDARDDLLLYGRSCYPLTQKTGGTTCVQVIPVASATSAGAFTMEQRPSTSGYRTATYDVVKPVVGDFNQDGDDDLVVFAARPHPYIAGEYLRSVAFVAVNGGTAFAQNLVSAATDTLLPRATAGGIPVAGDFNGDGIDDIAVAGAMGETDIPVMFMNASGQPPLFTSHPVTSVGTSTGPGAG